MQKTLDLVVLGATGFTGRQAVRAVLRQQPQARWAVAGRNAVKLRKGVDERLPKGGPEQTEHHLGVVRRAAARGPVRGVEGAQVEPRQDFP